MDGLTRDHSPEETADHMLQQPGCLLLNQLSYHIAEHRADSIEALICSTNIVESMIIEQDLLHDEDGHRLAQLRSSLHNAKAEWYDFGGQQEIDDIGRIILDQSSNYA
jgi:hypothetical protein